jgi:hypothetical protein
MEKTFHISKTRVIHYSSLFYIIALISRKYGGTDHEEIP